MRESIFIPFIFVAQLLAHKIFAMRKLNTAVISLLIFTFQIAQAGTLLPSSLNQVENFVNELVLPHAEAKLSLKLLMENLHISSNKNEFEASFVNLEGVTPSGYEFYQVELHHRGAGRIRFMLKGPPGFLNSSNRQLKTLTLVAGFFTGQETVKLLGDLPNTVVVGYEYPFNIDEIQKDPSRFLNLMRLTPGQIALMLSWLRSQHWVHPHEQSIMGVSLGGIILPVSLHLAQAIGAPAKKTVFVCTGADLRKILASNFLGKIPAPLFQMITESLATITQPLRPELHAPLLESQFLMVSANQDQVIPLESSRLLFSKLRNPKTEVLIEGDHVLPDKTEMIQTIQDIVLDWMGNS